MIEHIDRELWLSRLIEKCRPHFAARGYELPEAIRVSYGFPKGRKEIGSCFSSASTSDNHFEIFISPYHPDSEPHKIAETLVHELIHTLPCCFNHGKKFKKVMGAVGLTGKATISKGGPELWEWIDLHLEDIGPFPGKQIRLPQKEKKQTTRMLKCECPACGFIFRASQKAIHAVKGYAGEMRCPGRECSGLVKIAA